MALLVVVALTATCAVAQAREPFLPGQVRSQALAYWVWRPPCTHVAVAPIGAAEAASLPRTEVAYADVGNCTIRIERAVLSLYSDRRETEIQVCSIIVHEYGHLAGQGHSTDPHNVMYPYVEYSYPPCRALFPRTRSSRPRGDGSGRSQIQNLP